jgi:hypothetical protein
MHARILAALLAAYAAAGAAYADTVVVNDQVQVRQARVDTPRRGVTMADVEKQFGQPITRHPTVGGAPAQPPITRWDYKDFAVVFERNLVIDAVVTGG